MARTRINPIKASVIESQPLNAAPSVDVQSYFDELGALGYFSAVLGVWT
jgi:hypothetical protein